MNTRDRIEAESHKDPARLEREIDQQRDNIGDIISALENKLSPGELLDRMMKLGKGNGGEFARNLGNTVKANPVPALLASASLLWLYAGRNNPAPPSYASTSRSTMYSGSAEYSDSDVYTTGSHLGGNGYSDEHHRGIKDRAGGLKDRASSMRSGMSEKWDGAKSKVSSGASGAKESLRQQTQRAKTGFDGMLNENPMALGAIGIAVGALLGASLPTTEKEHRLMGDASARIKDKAKTAASTGYSKVNEAAREATRAGGTTGSESSRTM